MTGSCRRSHAPGREVPAQGHEQTFMPAWGPGPQVMLGQNDGLGQSAFVSQVTVDVTRSMAPWHQLPRSGMTVQCCPGRQSDACAHA